jgi:AP-3 complex subunit beta
MNVNMQQATQAAKKMADAGGDSHFLEEQMNPTRIKQYLDSGKDYDKVKGMKWLLAMMSKGRDASEFFSDVVKNVVAKSVEVKKMVYMYLSHYCDFNHQCRELALLSINSFQKDLAASNQLVRAMALRVMTSIRVPDVIQIQLLAVKKCAGDSSPYVRKCAANAIAKLVSLSDGAEQESCDQFVATLLNDTSPMVLGSAVTAFAEVCPQNWAIFHPNYRKLCQLLADCDEWAQITILGVLARYLRTQFMDPSPDKPQTSNEPQRIVRRKVKKAFYSDDEDESEEEVVVQDDPWDDDGPALEDDHKLALTSSLPLLKSRNSGVVLAVCSLHYHCGAPTNEERETIGRALVRILRNRPEIQYVVLKSIAVMASERPQMFAPFLRDFFVKGTDAKFNREIKLEILVRLATPDSVEEILRELQTYCRGAEKDFVCDACTAAARVADARPECADDVLRGLLDLARSHDRDECRSVDASVVSSALVAIRQLLQQGAGTSADDPVVVRRDVVRQVAKMLLKPKNKGAFSTNPAVEEDEGRRGGAPVPTASGRGASARASACFILGEFRDDVSDLLPDAVRLLASRFSGEVVEVKQQILNLAVKSATAYPSNSDLDSLLRYVLELARFDTDHDLRDRGRYLTATLGLSVPGSESTDETALAQLKANKHSLILGEKQPPSTRHGTVAPEGVPQFTVGSLSSMMGHEVDGYLPLEPWATEPSDPSIRNPPNGSVFRAGAGQTGISSEEVAANPGAFYGNDDESSSTESSSSGSDSDESDSDASSSEGSDSDDSEESSADASSASSSEEEEEESSSSGEEEAKAPPPADPFDMFAAPSSAPATSNDDILKMF